MLPGMQGQQVVIAERCVVLFRQRGDTVPLGGSQLLPPEVLVRQGLLYQRVVEQHARQAEGFATLRPVGEVVGIGEPAAGFETRVVGVALVQRGFQCGAG